MRVVVWTGLVAGLLLKPVSAADSSAPILLKDDAHLRRPVAAGLLDEGRLLVTANQRNGSVSLLDLETAKVVTELPVGKSLSGLAVLPGGTRFLVTDEARHKIVSLFLDGRELKLESRQSTVPYPVGVAVSPDGRFATVAGLWSRQLQLLDLARSESQADRLSPRVASAIPLPFAPRLQLMLPGSSHVVVADAFGGSLAVVDYKQRKIVATYEIAGHNLRGLALSPDGKELLISHQMLDQKLPITERVITRGELVQNVVRRIPLAQVIDAKSLSRNAGVTMRLDDGWIHGAADPAGLVPFDKNGLAVSLAGSNMLVVMASDHIIEKRINVGTRPLVALRAPRGGDVAVVNMLSDSVSLVDPTGDKIQREIPLGPVPKLSARDRGEILFFDGAQSVHGWLSCHSCHVDGHTNGLLADTSGDNSFGAPKRTPTLLGVSRTGSWAWNGEVPDASEQFRKSLKTTMHNGWSPPESVSDLAAYLDSLQPPPPREPARRDEADREQLARGSKLFSDRGCVKCHDPNRQFTSPAAYDVGLVDELGQTKFNPPSLRGVSQGRRFFHDNRAPSLDAVFTEHGHGIDTDLSPRDLVDLIRFLRSL